MVLKNGKPTCTTCGNRLYGIFYCVHGVPLDMVRMITWCEIVLPLSLEEERVIKVLLMFQNVMLQIRDLSMHSRLKKQCWIRMRMRMMVFTYNFLVV